MDDFLPVVRGPTLQDPKIYSPVSLPPLGKGRTSLVQEHRNVGREEGRDFLSPSGGHPPAPGVGGREALAPVPGLQRGCGGAAGTMPTAL